MWSSYRAHSELCFHLKKSKKKKTKNTVELHLNNKNQEQLHLQNAMQPLSICKSLSTIKKKTTNLPEEWQKRTNYPWVYLVGHKKLFQILLS